MKNILSKILSILLVSATALAGSGQYQPKNLSGGGVISGALSIFATSTEALLIGKAGDTGDLCAFDTSTTQLACSNTGTLTKNYLFAGSTSTPQFTYVNNGTMRFSMITHNDTGAFAPFLTYAKSRGTQASPTIVASGDTIGSTLGIGFDGVDYASLASIAFKVDGTPGSNDMPGSISFNTVLDGTAALVESVRINNRGQLLKTATGTIADSFVLATATITPDIVSVSQSIARLYQASYSDTSIVSPIITSLRARGTQASPTIVADDDRISVLLHSGFDGTDFSNSSGILFEVDGTPGTDNIPGRISLMTHDDGSISSVVARQVIENHGETTWTRGTNINALTASVEDPTYIFDSSATKLFATGAMSVYRDYQYKGPTIAFAGASTANIVFTQEFGAMPAAGANAEFNSSIGQLLGSMDGSWAYADSNVQAVVLMPQIPNGTSSVDRLIGFGVASVADISLGDQTRPVSEVNLVEVGGNVTLVSTGSITVGDAISLRSEAINAGSGVTLLEEDRYSAKFYEGIVSVSNARLQLSQGDTVASASTITLPYGNYPSTAGGNTFEVSGTTTIDYITSTGWTNGSEITLLFQDSLTVTSGGGSPPGTAKQILIEGGNFSATSGDMLKLQLNTVSGTTAWRVLSKSVL